MKKTNILLITSDQQHFDTLGAFNSEIETPNLDRLIKKGTTFDRAYCPNPTCTPTRASIITGQYPSQHGAWTLGTKLPEACRTLGDMLHEKEYKSYLVGKAHFQPLESTDEFTSLEAYPTLQDLDFWKTFNEGDLRWYGFDHVELTRNHTDEAHVGQHYLLWLKEKGCDNWKEYFRKPTGFLEHEKERVWQIPEEFHYNNWIAERTNCLIEESVKNRKPFFMWSSFFDPHPDYVVPEPYYSMYNPDVLTMEKLTDVDYSQLPPFYDLTRKDDPDFSEYAETGFAIHGMHAHIQDESRLRKQKAIYYGMVTMMDKYIGKILDKLDELNVAEETLIIFTTDHGHFIGHHGLSAKGPFMFEDMIKIPFIVSYPGCVEEDIVSNSLQSLVDLTPTILDFAGLESSGAITGLSQKDVWTGKIDKIREHVICEHHHEPTTIHLKTYVDERYKITVYYNQTYGELYDLVNDPNENINLWDDDNYKDLKMQIMMKYIWAELGKESMWMPRIAHA